MAGKAGPQECEADPAVREQSKDNRKWGQL